MSRHRQHRQHQPPRLGLLLVQILLLAGVAAAACPFGFSRETSSSSQQGDEPRRHLREETAKAVSSSSTPTNPLGDAPTPLTVEAAVRSYLLDIFRSDDSIPPLVVRLAWHDAGTYNAKENTGGPDGSIRFEPEFTNGANTGLSRAVQLLEPVKQAVPQVSYADLYQLASIEAIKYCGGPDIPFRMGRKDVDAPDDNSFQRLPDAKQGEAHLRDVFYRMGFVDREIVALSGAHTLGRAHFNSSGFEGPWTWNPFSFDNGYYQALLGNDGALLKLPTDLALLNAPSMRKWVELYAADQKAFFEDYVEAHTKLSELGVEF